MVSEWTVDTLREHIIDLLTAQDHRIEVRLHCIDEAIKRGELCTIDQKKLINHIRDEAITRDEYQLRHKAVEDQIKAGLELANERMNGMDSKRDDIAARVIKMEARSGTVNITLALSILSALLAGGMFIFSLVHPFIHQVTGG